MKSDGGIISALRASAGGTGRLGLVALAALVVCLMVGAVLAWPLISPPPLPTVGDDVQALSDAERTRRQARFETGLRLAKDRVANRSPFFPKRVAPPPAPPAPLTYGGPALSAMINDTAWFGTGFDTIRLRPGDPEVDGLEVIELRPPWDAVVRWRGGEFTVTLFNRSPAVLTGALDAMRSGAVFPAPAPPAPPVPAEASRPSSTNGSGAAQPSGADKPADPKPEDPKTPPAQPAEPAPSQPANPGSEPAPEPQPQPEPEPEPEPEPMQAPEPDQRLPAAQTHAHQPRDGVNGTA